MGASDLQNSIEMAYIMSRHVKENSYVIFANCYYPLIKRRLPSTFYLRYTFKHIMIAMGLVYIGRVQEGEPALVFQKDGELNLEKAIKFSQKMKLFGPVLNVFFPLASKIKCVFK